MSGSNDVGDVSFVLLLLSAVLLLSVMGLEQLWKRQNKGENMIRVFDLIRGDDITGMSGTGAVAEGVVFSDGTVALRWVSASPAAVERGVRPTTVLHENIESVEALHGHDGSTVVRYRKDW